GYEIADSVPNFGVSAFPNGNYLVRSPRWDNPVGPVVDAGAVTIGKGTGGTVGLITFSNSLVGTTPHGLPSVSYDYPRNRLFVQRPGSNIISIVDLTTKRTPADFDGDGRTDFAVFRPANRIWYLQRSQQGFSAYQWGLGTDKLAPADYDGDGKTDLTVYRPSTAEWSILRSSDNTLSLAYFGTAEDLPRPADYDGDGR